VVRLQQTRLQQGLVRSADRLQQWAQNPARCAACRTILAHAEALDEWWMDLCDQPGVSLNVAKHQRCAQTVEYSGFLFDTFRGLMLVTADKQALLQARRQVLSQA
jgi:hypothetical protein